MNLQGSKTDTDKRIYKNFSSILSSAQNESDIVPFIKKNLYLLRVFADAWNCIYGDYEFSFGGKFIADFLVLSADSGQWYAKLIEAESPTCQFYTKVGEEAKEMREARRQLTDWRIWIGKNEQSFRNSLADIVDDNTPAHCGKAQFHHLAKTELRDLNTVVHVKYVALLGRRFKRTEKSNQRMYQTGFEVATYDRLLDYAKRLENYYVSTSNI